MTFVHPRAHAVAALSRHFDTIKLLTGLFIDRVEQRRRTVVIIIFFSIRYVRFYQKSTSILVRSIN